MNRTLENIMLWLGAAYMAATFLAALAKGLSRLPGKWGNFFAVLYDVLSSISLDIEKLRGKP